MATILLALAHGEPLDEVVYCEVMFDNEISGEIPEHRDFIYEKAIPFCEAEGIKVNVVRGGKTFVSQFYKKIGSKAKNKQNVGKIWAWPLCGRCYVQRDCKVRPMERFKRENWSEQEVKQYVGIAASEDARISRMLNYNAVSLLEKYDKDEADAFYICRKAGLLSPCYEFTDRNGCWFCPNAKWKEQRHLRDYHRGLWDKLLLLQKEPNKITEKFNFNFTIEEIESQFQMEDLQMSLFL